MCCEMSVFEIRWYFEAAEVYAHFQNDKRWHLGTRMFTRRAGTFMAMFDAAWACTIAVDRRLNDEFQVRESAALYDPFDV